jgi:nucleotide-binding universal stress UspA family protein
MRILLAVDGSASSDRATQLVASLPLPPESLVRLVAVHHGHAPVLPRSLTTEGRDEKGPETSEQADARHRREAIERCERLLERPGLTVEGFVLQGRAASAIMDEAGAMEADLIVVGSRGHGTMATMLLGSTAAEVAFHAPCPVLVARSNQLGPVAFADDGSPPARTAEELFTRWPIFGSGCVSVVTVANLGVPVASYAPGLYPQALESYSESADEIMADMRAESMGAAGRLTTAGIDAEGTVLEGDPATELVRFATERGTGTIVMGTRGHTGLARIVLGSVARNVLLHAPCSVLVVREPKDA